MFGTDHDLSGWGWVATVVGMVLFWGLLFGLAVVLARALNRPPEEARRPPTWPAQILDERFARGEIDRAEYRRRQSALSASRQLQNRR